MRVWWSIDRGQRARAAECRPLGDYEGVGSERDATILVFLL